MIRAFVLLLSVALLGCSPQPEARAPTAASLDDVFERDDLVIVSNDGTRHNFSVYLATSFEQQRRGLMFVRDLPPETGMLFVYDHESLHSMWMKNTYIPLDIVFARRDGTVSSVIHDTEPLSLNSLSAVEPVAYVLELNAGVTRRNKIGAGSRLIWSPEAN